MSTEPPLESRTDPRTDGTRRALVDVAERLFAERGVAAVPLRTVSSAAGQRNHSAAQYHFGSREGLVAAIIAARSPRVDERRRRMLDELDANPPQGRDLPRRLVEVLVRPWADCLLDDGESHYLRFLARCMDDADLRASWRSAHLDPPSVHEANTRLGAALSHVPRADLVRRLEWVAALSLHVLADEERGGEADPRRLETVCADLVGMLTALLEQPVPSPGRQPKKA